ncbi:MAG TPA: hypothetical protein VG714_08320 [Acidobacteriaceae bacterium]|nr:hypothetical protein [Acidobacteriaceae bacterium]
MTSAGGDSMRWISGWWTAGLIVSFCACGGVAAVGQSFAGADIARQGMSSTGQGMPSSSDRRMRAADILARVARRSREREAELERYESERTYTVEYAGTGREHHAEIDVRAEFSELDGKRLTVMSESGSKFLCGKVLRRLVESEEEAAEKENHAQIALTPENYSAELLGEEKIGTPSGTVRAWVLEVTPRAESKFTYRGLVWVSEQDDAVVRIEGEPAKNPSWWISHASFTTVYARRGGLWLPAKNTSVSHVRMGGDAKLTIDYGRYSVIESRRSVVATEDVMAANAGGQ